MKPKVPVRTICIVAMLIALTFVLERLLPIWNMPTLRVTLAFVPMMCCGMFFGPIWGAMAYGISDVLGWTIMPLTPIPLVLVSRVIEGLIFGTVLHREDLKFFPHAVTATLSTQIICGAGLTTLGLWLVFFYDEMTFFPFLYTRLPQFAIYIALQLALFPALVRLRSALQKSGVLF